MNFPTGCCRRMLKPIWCSLSACQMWISVGVSSWRKSRERWGMAGGMRWSFVGFGMRLFGVPARPGLPSKPQSHDGSASRLDEASLRRK